MPGGSDILISDTSCLILLTKIGELDLLQKVGREVIITPEIREEYGSIPPGWISEIRVKDQNYQQILQRDLDIGEASAIALALELDNPVLVIRP